MSCVSCDRSILLPKCIDSFEIGSIAATNQEVFIYIKNHSTGRLIRQDGISSIAGLITVNATDIVFNQNQAYEIWVTEWDSQSINDRIELTHEAVDYSCVNVSFTNVYNSNNTSSTQYPYVS